ncbi:FadR/GntR family transcriptional regulator [Pedobacter sp. ASV28]|uniref:FadR/GntR family transcriptional regulator n=1 Tax=Pedobacter sp. ASV28 TaxID=2795123 RepID=UPI0018EB4687|nr:FadR/GntR family transcriptional regulator [Pedobacter sp. ASV28]
MTIIQRKSLAQEVADALKIKIGDGTYQLNEKLPTEPDLMKQYGVGRSTIREAIKLLGNSGYVTVQQGIGTFVTSIKGSAELDHKIEKANFTDLHEIRQLLEIKIVELAALHRTEEDLIKISKALNDRNLFAKNGETGPCIHADIAFHVAIADSCKNSLLAELYKTTSVHITKFFIDQYSDTSTFIDTQLLHEKLFQHIKNQNPKKALIIINQIINI